MMAVLDWAALCIDRAVTMAPSMSPWAALTGTVTEMTACPLAPDGIGPTVLVTVLVQLLPLARRKKVSDALPVLVIWKV